VDIFAHFTVLQLTQYLYFICNTESVRRDEFFRNVLILLRKFGLFSIAVKWFNFHVSKIVKKIPQINIPINRTEWQMLVDLLESEML